MKLAPIATSERVDMCGFSTPEFLSRSVSEHAAENVNFQVRRWWCREVEVLRQRRARRKSREKVGGEAENL